MIQGENKQDYLDANSPSEIEKRARAKREAIKLKIMLQQERQKTMAQKEATTLISETRKIQSVSKANKEAIYSKSGEAAGSVASKVVGGIKRFIVSAAKQQASTNKAQERAIAQRRAAYINQQRKIAEMKRKRILSQRMQNINNQRRQQVQIRRPQLSPLQQQQMMMQQQLLRQRQIAEQKRQLVRTLTPGFYNPKAERVNPFGLASRYKMNFAQNIFTEKDPENQKVHVNGKYKWRAD